MNIQLNICMKIERNIKKGGDQTNGQERDIETKENEVNTGDIHTNI